MLIARSRLEVAPLRKWRKARADRDINGDSGSIATRFSVRGTSSRCVPPVRALGWDAPARTMPTALLLTVMLAAPAAAGPSVHPDRRELGRLWVEQSSTFTWPGLQLPAFTLVPDRRRIHGLTLGLDLPKLRWLTFDAMLVEPSDDPDIRRLTSRLPTGEGTSAYAWAGVRARIPSSRWQLRAGYAWAVRGASTMAGRPMGRGGMWMVNLVRPLR